MNITEKAMLVNLSISQWTARRFDRKATNRVIEDFSAGPDSGRFNKLLVDLVAVKRYQKAANEARVFHYENTLPWGDDDSRILPASNYLPYTKKMRELRSSFEAAVDEFVSEYPDLINRAQRDLNGLFSPEDYPEVGSLHSKFRFSVSVSPVPDSGDFRVSLSQDEVEQIKADIEARVKDSVSSAMRDAWNRLYQAVKHMVEKLRDRDSIFRDSLVGNIAELCDILPRLNLTGDSNLAKMIYEAKMSLASLDPEILRKYELERKAAADKAENVLSKMSAYVGD